MQQIKKKYRSTEFMFKWNIPFNEKYQSMNCVRMCKRVKEIEKEERERRREGKGRLCTCLSGSDWEMSVQV